MVLPESERIAVLESEVRNLSNDVNTLAREMWVDFAELRAARRRPSWAVTTVLAVQSSMVVGLTVALLN